MKKEKQMKEQKEIVDKIKTSNDFFGFQQEVLVPFLDYENAKEFLKPEVKKVAWKKSQVKLNKETVLEQMKDYMEFAWEKCSGHRGLSASRSLEKMRAWLWLLSDTEMIEFSDDEDNYPNYGAPVLAKISKKYGFKIPKDKPTQNMIKGLACGVDYECGCGQ